MVLNTQESRLCIVLGVVIRDSVRIEAKKLVNKEKNMKSESCIEAKEDKHILLDNAIDDIDNVIQQAYCILQRIQGDGSGCGTAEEKKTPSLQEVLNHAPDRIREKNNELLKILDEMNSMLF